MINLSTKPEDMVRELMADRDKSSYWLKKKFGGEKAYEKMRDKLLFECKRDKKNKVSETVEYRSANGNRWLTYECARYYKEANMVHTEPYAFCFYETLGSVGAFVPVKLGSTGICGKDAVIIFTSHFFKQMCERLGVGFRTPEMVRAFHEFIPSLTINLYKDEEGEKIHVRLPGSIGFGVKLKGNALVFEVRTFLKDTQLNNKQKNMTEQLRSVSGQFNYEPQAVMQQRLKKKLEEGGDLKDEEKKMKEKFMMMGWSEKEYDQAFNICLWMVHVFVSMGLTTEEDTAFWERHFKNNFKDIYQFLRDGNPTKQGFYDLLQRCAVNNGFNRFDMDKAKLILDEIVKNHPVE